MRVLALPVRKLSLAEDDDLLLPRFYLARGLADWLEPTVREWMAERPYCTT